MVAGAAGGATPIDRHLQIVGWLHVGVGVVSIGLLLGLGGRVLAWWADHRYTEAYGSLLTTVVCGLAISLAVLPVLQVAGGLHLLRGRPGGRALVTVFSVIHLPNVPLGTAAGAYSLWALWLGPGRPEARRRS